MLQPMPMPYFNIRSDFFIAAPQRRLQGTSRSWPVLCSRGAARHHVCLAADLKGKGLSGQPPRVAPAAELARTTSFEVLVQPQPSTPWHSKGRSTSGTASDPSHWRPAQSTFAQQEPSPATHIYREQKLLSASVCYHCDCGTRHRRFRHQSH